MAFLYPQHLHPATPLLTLYPQGLVHRRPPLYLPTSVAAMDSIQSTFQNFIANVFPSQAKAVTNDPILLLAKHLDLPITFYRVEPAPWLNFLIYGPFHLSVLTVLGLVLFQASRLGAGSYLRALAAVLGAVFFTTWPLFIRSGLDFLDFGIPAFGEFQAACLKGSWRTHRSGREGSDISRPVPLSLPRFSPHRRHLLCQRSEGSRIMDLA